MQIYTLNHYSCAGGKEHKQLRIYFYAWIYRGHYENLINCNKHPNINFKNKVRTTAVMNSKPMHSPKTESQSEEVNFYYLHLKTYIYTYICLKWMRIFIKLLLKNCPSGFLRVLSSQLTYAHRKEIGLVTQSIR